MKKYNEYIIEDLTGALVEPNSKSSDDAAELGLVYVGFGRYEDPETQQVTHIVQDDRLIPIGKATKTNSFKEMSKDDYGSYIRNSMVELDSLHKELTDYYVPDVYDESELEAIETYTSGNHININKRLLGLPTGIPSQKIVPEVKGDLIPKVISALDSALVKLPSPKKFITHASVSSEYSVDDFVAGSMIVFKGYRSTSLNMNMAINYANNTSRTPNKKQLTLLHISIKKGSFGIYADDFSATPGEYEYILPRSSSILIKEGPFKLVGSNAYTEDDNLEILYFDCELIQDK